MRNLEPIFTSHTLSRAGEVFGFVYARPLGGFIGMVEVKTDSGVFHPELPIVYDDRKVACEAVSEKVMDFDWALGHPWMEHLATVSVDNPVGFDDMVEDLVNFPVEHGFDLESIVI